MLPIPLYTVSINGGYPGGYLDLLCPIPGWDPQSSTGTSPPSCILLENDPGGIPSLRPVLFPLAA